MEEDTHLIFITVLGQVRGIEKTEQLRESVNFLKDKRKTIWEILQLDSHKKDVDSFLANQFRYLDIYEVQEKLQFSSIWKVAFLQR